MSVDRSAGRGAADLLRAIGLLADGPVPWGRPVSGRGPGLYLVELPSPPIVAPIDLGKVGEWLTRRPELRLDGARPTGKELAGRLATFWLPGEPVIFAGSTELSIGGRVTALYRHVLGERKPHPEGQWLHVLHGLTDARVWWASTDAPDEALDALLTAFAQGVSPAVAAAFPEATVVLPFATTRRPTGERKAHGLTGHVAPAERTLPPAPARLIELPPGSAEGTEATEAGPGMAPRTVVPPASKPIRRRPDEGSGPARRATPTVPAPRRTARASRVRTTAKPAGGTSRAIPPTVLTPDGLARLQAEHDELTTERRPAVIQRIRTAKEHGDLSENAEYHAAREEQSFLEGRIQAIEAILRNHTVIAAPPAGHSTVHLGSRVTIEDDFGQIAYTIVGSTEANPAEGRISASSPVGAALLGHQAGDAIMVRTPRGELRYRVVSIE